MSEADLLAWCVPLALSVLSAIFFGIGRVVRGGNAWGIGYALAATGYALAIVPASDLAVPKALLEDALLLSAVAAIARGISLRFHRPSHDGAAAAVVALTVATAAAALIGLESVAAEIMVIQTSAAAFALFAAAQMRGKLKKLVNRILFALAILLASNLLFQNAYFLIDPAPELTLADWRLSSWAFFFQLGGIVFGLLFAFTALIAIGVDSVERYRVSSETDLLSGLLNRRGFELRLQAATQQRGVEGALILIDVDNFKAVNDDHGHATGDMVIAGIGALLGLFGARVGFAGRMGGEEFALFIPAADCRAGALYASEIRNALNGIEWPIPFAAPITASFGVAQARYGEGFEAAYKRADARLYDAKKAGRDRIVAMDTDSALDEHEQRARTILVA